MTDSDDNWVGIKPRRLNDRSTRSRKTRKTENRVAEAVGGRRLRGSGAGRVSSKPQGNISQGFDIQHAAFTIEHKRTEKKSMSVKAEWLDKIRHRARMEGKSPCVILTYEKLGIQADDDWAMIPLELFNRLKETLDDG